MKLPILSLTSIFLLFLACSSPTKNQQSTKVMPTGQTLIASADCGSCHQEQNKTIGPAYQQIAAKYPNTAANQTLLAKSIINGGTGVWGQIPMTPHPNLSQKEAEEMVKYILSLKK